MTALSLLLFVISLVYRFLRMFKPHASHRVKISYGRSPPIYMVDFTHQFHVFQSWLICILKEEEGNRLGTQSCRSWSQKSEISVRVKHNVRTTIAISRCIYDRLSSQLPLNHTVSPSLESENACNLTSSVNPFTNVLTIKRDMICSSSRSF